MFHEVFFTVLKINILLNKDFLISDGMEYPPNKEDLLEIKRPPEKDNLPNFGVQLEINNRGNNQKPVNHKKEKEISDIPTSQRVRK